MGFIAVSACFAPILTLMGVTFVSVLILLLLDRVSAAKKVALFVVGALVAAGLLVVTSILSIWVLPIALPVAFAAVVGWASATPVGWKKAAEKAAVIARGGTP